MKVVNCAQCGQEHEEVKFHELVNPIAVYRYWGECPNTKAPILLSVHPNNKSTICYICQEERCEVDGTLYPTCPKCERWSVMARNEGSRILNCVLSALEGTGAHSGNYLGVIRDLASHRNS